MAYTPEYIFSLKDNDVYVADFISVKKKLDEIHLSLSNRNTKKISTGRYPSNNTRNIIHNNHNSEHNNSSGHDNNSNNSSNSNVNSHTHPNNGWRTAGKEKYKPQFASKNTDDLMKRSVSSILGKLSNANYDVVEKDLGELLMISDDTYEAFTVDMLFNNSIQQPLFCKHYANLLKLIKNKQIIRNKYVEYLDTLKNEEKDDAYKKGYTSFIAETYNHGIIDMNDMSNIIVSLFNDIDESSSSSSVYAEYLLIIFKKIDNINSFGKKKDKYAQKALELSKNKKIKPMYRYKLMDISEVLLKSNTNSKSVY